MPLLASILIAEIVVLLIAPIAYSVLLLPRIAGPPFRASSNAWGTSGMPPVGLPLTDSQIKAAWPHLPTAQEVVDSNYGSLRAYYQPQNETVLAISDAYGAPPGAYVCYNIWLQINSTTWIQVPYNYLATSNPPYPQYVQARSNGFLGTGLSTSYVVIAITVVIATLLAGAIYVLHKKGKSPEIREGSYGLA